MSVATLFCGLILLMTSLGPINAQEGNALISIMQKWKVDLLNWEPGTDHCSWPKVKCDGQKNVIFLDLSGVGLSGLVPEEVGTLTSLEYLDLSNNQIRGELYPLGSLTNLQVLNVSLNALGGGFPYVVFKLTKLIDLRVDNLYLSGPFPKGWTALKNLEYLYIGNNTMTGPLPSELGKLSNLKELTLWNNPIKSALPSELGSLSKLTYLNVHGCSMWGPLPAEFSQLKNMERLHLYDNYFTGRVPDSWKNMTNLMDLRLQYNGLTGSEFPAWIPNHPKLKRVYLSYNQMYSYFPDLSNSNFSTVRLECCFYRGPKPIQPPLIDKFFYDFNCFDGQVIDYGPRNCSRDTTCEGFFRRLDQYGCPPCPRGQIPLNISACVCGIESETSSSRNDNIKIFFPTAIGFIVVLLIVISLFIQSRRSRKRRQFKNLLASNTDDGDWDVPAGVQRFRIEDIARFTRNFHVGNQIGAGGFGKVFVGTLESGKKLAIKCSSMASLQGSTEFRNEVVLLSRLHHCNLVHLEGFCEDDGLRVLVYEFIENGNLHTWLSEKNGIRHILGWRKRLEISLDIAQGLDYLHSFADPPVIHRDIKPSNILLDANLIAKLCDFGLSKATPEFETHLSTSPAGTAGYIDPQYFLRQHLTTASDVYGFGIVLLELITGQKSIDESRMEEINLVEWVKLMITSGGIRAVVDPFLGSDYPEKIYEKFIELAVKCASFKRQIRPTMKEIVGILEYLLQNSPPDMQDSTSEMDRGTISAHTSDPVSESERNAYFQLTPR